MFKKSLIFLLALTANLLAIANPTIKIGSYVDTLTVNYNKFVEPVVYVYDGSANVTKQYNITYGFENFTEETDSRGVRIVKDTNTGATVEKYYGDVVSGMAGIVKVLIKATNKETGEVLESAYSITVKSNAVKLTFAPQFGSSTKGNDGSLTLATSRIALNDTTALYYVPSASSILPVYTLTTSLASGKSVDVSEYYNVDINYSGSDKISFKDDILTYIGIGDQWNIRFKSDSIDSEINILNNTPSAITYTFTPKEGYAGIYDPITRVIDVNVNIDLTGAKHRVHLSLPRELFKEANVTGSDSLGYTIHVYKYGLSDMGTGHHYVYSNPLPSVLTEGGAQLGTRVDSKGNWGDFKLYFKIVSDSTYYDDCWHAGVVQKAGESTQISFLEDRFQVKLPGLVKVAVYAYLPDGYGDPLRKTYEPLVVDGDTVRFGNNTMYSEPVYFYIDIMKRVADLKFTPDPSTIVFAKGDKVYIPDRFSVYGEIDNNSNGIAAGMIWDPYNSGTKEIDGKLYELFDYSFFISDRMNNNYIRLNNWPYDAGRHKEDWIEASEMAIGTDVTVGDKILVDGEYILVDSTNIADYADRKIQKGDLEHGITYLAMRYWGNEQWTIEFLETGRYSIPYTIRPWNHDSWDDGGNNNLWTFQVAGTISTKIDLSYTFQTAPIGLTDYDEPIAKVIAPEMNNYDVTEKYNLKYSIESDANKTGTTVVDSTGQITIGSCVGDVVVRVHADRKSAYQNIDEVYENPADAFYTIRIIDPKDNATWEIISTCKNDACEINGRRFNDASKANGRFHFLTEGNLYGGTIINGVPGISMTIGAAATDITDAAEWSVIETSTDHVKCCQHEEGNGVASKCTTLVTLDTDNIPTAGGFYKFTPIVNGYLTIDAKFNANDKIVIISKQSGDIIEEDTTFAAETLCDVTFKKALIAGETYYLYNLTNNDVNNMGINLHGFAYQPAYVIDRNTTLAESEAGIEATTFMNGLSSSLPSILKAANKNVSFKILPGEYSGAEPSEYLTVDRSGSLYPLQMTMAGDDIFYLVVKATVKSSDTSLGSCVTKTSEYKIKVIEIPTYMVPEDGADFAVLPGDVATTDNIPTDITMTFGGWSSKYGAKDFEDKWEYTSKGGAASRIPSEEADNDPTYNKTIDGFKFFAAGNNNPVDELDKSALHNGQYLYGSGVAFEDQKHSTTYNLPCKGSFIKFEPRESGVVLVYLVQNGCCYYHYGLSSVGTYYQLKWNPLYITDETGKPATMVNDFGSMSKFLPTGKDQTNAGSYTLGISRCNKYEAAVTEAWDYNSAEAYGTSFDWSKFQGSDDDRERLLAAWPAKGERESIIRLDNGGFVLPHKAYVRYAFQVKAGKTYFVFQPGSKFELGGFSFVPTGYPTQSKFGLNRDLNEQNMERNIDGENGSVTTKSFTWNDDTNPLSVLNTEAENLIVDINDQTDNRTLKKRTFKANTWNAVCLPFSVSSNELTRVFGEGYQLMTCDNYNDDVIHLLQHANTYMEAGRPYFIYPSIDGEMHFENISIEGKTVVKTSNGQEEWYTPITNPSRFNFDIGEDYTLRGIYGQEDLPAYSYFTVGNKFAKFAFNFSIGGYRSYFRIKDSNTNPAKAVKFAMTYLNDERAGEETTGIIYIDKENNMNVIDGDPAIYNANGQMIGKGADTINSAAHGVYIMNGKKFIK